jgi:hypothetical protein
MSEFAVVAMILVGAVACIIAAIQRKQWLLLLAALGLLVGVLMLAVWH